MYPKMVVNHPQMKVLENKSICLKLWLLDFKVWNVVFDTWGIQNDFPKLIFFPCGTVRLYTRNFMLLFVIWQNFKNVVISGVFEIIRESQLQYPVICRKALESLADILGGLQPEELSNEPNTIIDPMFETLLELATIDSSDDDIRSLASCCLLRYFDLIFLMFSLYSSLKNFLFQSFCGLWWHWKNSFGVVLHANVSTQRTRRCENATNSCQFTTLCD